jgi:hypothetical protein
MILHIRDLLTVIQYQKFLELMGRLIHCLQNILERLECIPLF